MSSTEEEDSNGKLKMLCLHGFLQSAAVSPYNNIELLNLPQVMHGHTAVRPVEPAGMDSPLCSCSSVPGLPAPLVAAVLAAV
jgi:hypothetical protein